MNAIRSIMISIIIVVCATSIFTKGGFVKDISESQNKLAFELFSQMAKESTSDENLVFSPYSIFNALMMSANGAGGETRTEFVEVLNIRPNDMKMANSLNRSQIEHYNSLQNNPLQITNSMWFGQRIIPEIEYVKTIEEFYYAEIRNIDFANTDAADTINKWIAQKTMGKIPDMIEETDIGDVLYIINTIYFNSQWQIPFDIKRTQAGKFQVTVDDSVETEFMSATDNFAVAGFDSYEAALLSFDGNNLAMLAILPNHILNPGELANLLEYDEYSDILKTLSKSSEKVELSMPKFKIGYDTKLNKSLESIGLNQAFDPVKADFSDIFRVRDGIWIDQILHEALLEIDEQGAEGVAATAVEFSKGATVETQSLIFDRPFVFAIIDRQSQNIIFLGYYINPETQKE